jgi:hypothetical protein
MASGSVIVYKGDMARPDLREPHRAERRDEPPVCGFVLSDRRELPVPLVRALVEPALGVLTEPERLRLAVALLLDRVEPLAELPLRLLPCEPVLVTLRVVLRLLRAAERLHDLLAVGVDVLDPEHVAALAPTTSRLSRRTATALPLSIVTSRF